MLDWLTDAERHLRFQGTMSDSEEVLEQQLADHQVQHSSFSLSLFVLLCVSLFLSVCLAVFVYFSIAVTLAHRFAVWFHM